MCEVPFSSALDVIMLINRSLKFGLGLIVLDSILRIAIICFWFVSPESAPDIPIFYKGVKYPEVQGAILSMNSIVLISAFLPSWRTPQSFSFLARLSTFVGIIIFVLGVLYSFNVAGSAFFFVLAANGFRQAVKSHDT